MKIAHASIPADDPKAVADVLAEIMGGESMPFPPGGPQARAAWSGDGAIMFEVVQRGDVLAFADEEGAREPAAGGERRSEVHLAVCVSRPASEVIAIAERAGWPARICQRGNGLFELAELWIEGVFMVEMLDPAQAARYEEVVTPANMKRFFSEMGANAAG